MHRPPTHLRVMMMYTNLPGQVSRLSYFLTYLFRLMFCGQPPVVCSLQARRSFPRRDSHFPSIMRPFLAGMASTAVVLYLFGWDFTAGGAAHTDRGLPPAMYVHGSGRNSPQGIAAVQDRKSPSLENSALGNRPTRTRGVGDGRLQEVLRHCGRKRGVH